MADKKELEKRIAELEAELEKEREYSNNADRWIDLLFDNLEFIVNDLKEAKDIIDDAKDAVLRGDGVAVGYHIAKARESLSSNIRRWDYGDSRSTLSNLRRNSGYTYVDRTGWIPKGVYDAECEGFEYPDRPREGRDESWHQE